MYRPFNPGAPRDIDEAARKISRILDRERESRVPRVQRVSATQSIARADSAPLQLAQNVQPTGTGLTDDDIFNMFAFDNTRKWEDFRDRVDYDDHGVPTVGYGYALVVNGPNGWAVRDDADLQSVGITLAPGDRQRLDQVATALRANRNARPARRLEAARSAVDIADFGTTLTEEGARNTFDLAVPEYKQYVIGTINEKQRDSFGNEVEIDRFSRLSPEQQAALFDLAYRNPSWLLNHKVELRDVLEADFSGGTWANTSAALGAILPRRDARGRGDIDYFQNPKAEWVYQVRPGEVFSRDIAPQIGVTSWDEVAALNPHITDPDDIQSGQRIYFPPPKTRRSGRAR